MLFNSLPYMVFFTMVVCLNYLLPVKARVFFLLVASWGMYICWIPKHILVLVGITIISYAVAICIPQLTNSAFKKMLLGVGIVACIGSLILFKYLEFFMEMFKWTGTWEIRNSIFSNWGVPVGLSFFSLQAVGYMVDVYRRKYPPEYNFMNYALFMSFFPQMAAGPIARGDIILPQLRNLQRNPNIPAFREGLCLVFVGYFKKIVLADTLGIYVNGVYANLSDVSGLSVLIAVLTYSLVIYFDFSGYSDIAVGCGKMLGINLMVNFHVPYASKTIKLFWANWHISLSSWLRDYVYFPLGGGKFGKLRKYINILIIFLVSGLWHGAAWTFIIWGGVHGIYRIFEEVFVQENFGGKLRICVNYALYSVAWIFFRAESMPKAFEIINSIGNAWGNVLSDLYMVLEDQTFHSLTFNFFYLVTVISALLLGRAIDKVYLVGGKGNYGRLVEYMGRKKFMVYYMGILIIFYFVFLNGTYAQAGQFIYFEF